METQQNGRYTLAIASDITCVAHTHNPCYLEFEYTWLAKNKHYTVPILKLWLWRESDAWRLGQSYAKIYINRIPILRFVIAKNARAHERTGRPIP